MAYSEQKLGCSAASDTDHVTPMTQPPPTTRGSHLETRKHGVAGQTYVTVLGHSWEARSPNTDLSGSSDTVSGGTFPQHRSEWLIRHCLTSVTRLIWPQSG